MLVLWRQCIDGEATVVSLCVDVHNIESCASGKVQMCTERLTVEKAFASSAREPPLEVAVSPVPVPKWRVVVRTKAGRMGAVAPWLQPREHGAVRPLEIIDILKNCL